MTARRFNERLHDDESGTLWKIAEMTRMLFESTPVRIAQGGPRKPPVWTLDPIRDNLVSTSSVPPGEPAASPDFAQMLDAQHLGLTAAGDPAFRAFPSALNGYECP